MKRRWLLASLLAAAGIAALGIRSAIPSLPRLFRRNAELKAQGFYMGDFEFKLLAAQQALNEGRHLEALRIFRRIEAELKDPRGLAKVPADPAPEVQMAFLLDRQDPATGAFMAPGYPAFTYFAPTANAVEHLAELARKTGRPLRLEHPLRFLDGLQDPQRLRAYLDGLLYLRPLWARLPGPGPYGPGVSELAYWDELEQAGAYRFSAGWKDTLRNWFQETQDPATGFWGVRIGTPAHWRQKLDINSTYHILHLLVDDQGRDRDPAFPLRHAPELARTLLVQLHAPLPEDADAQHDWGLCQTQGLGLLTRRLWLHLEETQREELRRACLSQLEARFPLYRPAAGGFAYYTSDPGADLDGTGLALGLLQAAGALPGTWERQRLWQGRLAAPPAPEAVQLRRWEDARWPADGRIRSLRVYADELPAGDGYDDAHLVLVAYPGKGPACDVMELRQGIQARLAAPGPAYGNWTSREALRDWPLGLDRPARAVPVVRGQPDLAGLARSHPGAKRFFVQGVDAAQVPVSVTGFSLRP